MNQEQEKIYNELISKYNFNPEQKRQILSGIKLNLNVFIYTNPNFDNLQMLNLNLIMTRCGKFV